LPVCFLLVVFAGRKLLTRSTAAPVAAASPAPAKAAVSSRQTLPLAILAASLRLPHGTSAEEFALSLAANKARADLDDELVDSDGFPIMTARSSEAVDEELREEMTVWLALNGMADLHFSDEQWRAVTLGSAVIIELAAQAAGPMLYQVDVQTKLQLIPILPTEWDLAQRRAASMWFRHMIARHGWPADRVVMSLEDVTASTAIKRLTDAAATTNTPLIAIVVACASYVGDETIARWTADGSLFTSSHPQGRMPGEGAAGLLITNEARLADTATVAVLDGIDEARRDSSADEAKRSDPSLLADLTERTLKRSGISASDVAMLIADTGHRSSRGLELMAHVSSGLPQLEETDGVVRIGVASGTCDAVPFITALALARHYVVERKAPVLCIGNEDPYCRVVALMRASERPS
jgi:hypothetical protein